MTLLTVLLLALLLLLLVVMLVLLLSNVHVGAHELDGAGEEEQLVVGFKGRRRDEKHRCV